jgi:hypothetical protein
MNKQQFLSIIQDPKNIHRISFEALENIIEQYPYFQAAYDLLAQKAQHTLHANEKGINALAATYVSDRNLLYAHIQETKLTQASLDSGEIWVSEPFSANEQSDTGTHLQEEATKNQQGAADTHESNLKEVYDEMLIKTDSRVEEVLEKIENDEWPDEVESIPIAETLDNERIAQEGIIEEIITNVELENTDTEFIPTNMVKINQKIIDDDAKTISAIINRENEEILKLTIERDLQRLRDTNGTANDETTIIDDSLKPDDSLMQNVVNTIENYKNQDLPIDKLLHKNKGGNDIINNDETTAISDYKAQFTEKLPSSFNNDDISNDDDNYDDESFLDQDKYDSGDMISETLANLYANQGYNNQAIDIYQRLSLKYPEKSFYFAGKIEEIKKLM